MQGSVLSSCDSAEKAGVLCSRSGAAELQPELELRGVGPGCQAAAPPGRSEIGLFHHRLRLLIIHNGSELLRSICHEERRLMKSL